MKLTNSEVTFTPQPEIVFVPEVQLLTFPIKESEIDLWEFQLKDHADTYFLGLTPEDKMDYLDQEEPDQWDSFKWEIIDDFVEKKTESFDKRTDECEDIIDNITDDLAMELVGRLKQFQIDRARKVAVGMQEMFALNPDTELEGCQKMLDMSEDILSDINQDLVPEGNADVIYWETFRDHFAFSVAQLSMDF